MDPEKKKYIIDEISSQEAWRLFRILAEFVEGFDALANIGPAVTFFGSARATEKEPEYEAARSLASKLAKDGCADHHGGRTGRDGGREPRRAGGGRALDRAQHRASLRAAPEHVRRQARRVPLLLRPQGDVRQILGRLRHSAGRLRDDGRALRGAHAHTDAQDQAVPRVPPREELLGGTHRLG